MEDFTSICYKTNFLSNVIFRIDFAPILKINIDELAEFQEAIRKELPEVEIKDLVTLKADLQLETNSFEKETSKLIIFKSLDSQKRIEVSQSFLAIVFGKYNSFEEFLLLVEKAFDELNRKFSPVIKRVGLRYVNNIIVKQGNPLDWKNLIHESLLSNLSGDLFDVQKLSRMMTQVNYNEDDYNIVFNYGIFNIEFPAKISRREFILDYDCYAENPNPLEINKLVRNFHTEIQVLFEKSIKHKLKELMNEN
jgi:uncharacterized protein (TIGR04255 family)